MIGQWIYVFFRRGHPKLRNRPTILVSFESTGPYQRNGASLVFMRCVVLEILDGAPVTSNLGGNQFWGSIFTMTVPVSLACETGALHRDF